MSDFLEWDLAGLPEQSLLDPPGPYLFTIKKAGMVDAKTGRRGFYAMLLTDEVPNHRPLFHKLYFPMKGDPEENVLVMLTMIKTLFDAAKYDYSGIGGPAALEEHLTELEDLQIRASVSIEPANEKEGYPESNAVKAFLNL